MKSNTTIILLVLAFSPHLFGQCGGSNTSVPQLKDIVVSCIVAKSPATPFFTFRYTIVNGKSSAGCVERFQLDISAPANSEMLSDSGLVDYPRYVDREALGQTAARSIVPVGVPFLPSVKGRTSAWWAGFSVSGQIDWIR